MASILLLDNYDSFTYNLYHLIQKNYNGQIVVKRDYELDENLDIYNAFVISPGPGRPETTPAAMNILKRFSGIKPILGVCLGMQCINEYFGGKTVRSNRPVHGKSDILIRNSDSILFNNLPQQFEIARYHSLKISPSPKLIKTGATKDGTIMAIEHPDYPIFGVQFHPESFLCQYGNEIIQNFLEVIESE